MQTQVIYRFALSQEDWNASMLYDIEASSDRLLGVALVTQDHEHDQQPPFFSFMLIDISTGTKICDVMFTCSCKNLEDIQLGFDAQENVWLITVIESFALTRPSRIMLYALSLDGHIVSGYPVLISEAVDDLTEIGPLLLMTADTECYNIFYYQPTMDNVDIPSVYLGQLSKAKDPIQLTYQEITAAEKALIYVDRDDYVVAQCRSEYGEFLGKIDGVFSGATAQWRFSLMGSKGSVIPFGWYYSPNIGLPVGNRASPDDDSKWLVVEGNVVSGFLNPWNGQKYFVVSIMLKDIFDYEARGYTVGEREKIIKTVDSMFCLDENGNLVRVCSDHIGLQLSICNCGPTIVGVDLVERQRRLWNWFPLNDAQFNKEVQLDQGTLRATVVAAQSQNENTTPQFWLIEECKEHVKISKHDAITLSDVSSLSELIGMRILYKEKHWRYLKNQSLLMATFKDKLLLLGIENDKQLILYQIE